MRHIVAIIFYFTPFAYLSFHGWAAKNLIDTAAADRLAVTFYVASSAFGVAYFIWGAQ